MPAANPVATISMAVSEIAPRLEGIPVYAVVNGANEFVLVGGENDQRIGFFCFRYV